ncbi:MAG: dihydroorotate dehydrogenase [Armatimonadetes bacterium]|nr:dihydroorotate dehydrogenase [Armatimonadota bacterium]
MAALQIDLSVQLAGLTLANPVLVASGTFGYGTEYGELVDVGRLGGICTKAVTLQPRAGNPPPRICETPAGMLNAIGLQNPGVEVFISEKMPALREMGIPIIVNIAGESVADYVSLAQRLSDCADIAALELNLSCPNVKRGGMQFGIDSELTERVVTAVREATELPLIAKLSPNVTDIVSIAQAARDGGADALSLINTLVGMSIDIQRRRPVLANVTGGLSGPAIRPVAVRMVWEVAQAVNLPIIGMGGITSAADALQFIMAGATAVAVGTANFVEPDVAVRIINDLEDFCQQAAVACVADLIGAAHSSSDVEGLQ